MCITTAPGTRIANQRHHRRGIQPAGVVDDRRTGPERGGRDLRLPTVDRHDEAVVGEQLERRKHAIDLLVRRQLAILEVARLRAEIDDRRAGSR